ncbi:uncharacterized protein K452DRAFT_271736 [Aplosporella prunicola CBS 121167]|uniref:Uncharacterized protein n=1 Tax=Aplosporella prunicola CBS 121167 TaxID=1176127 RepID=A0A6A6BCE8_9PEZI|nr:uncharacterized protein K452DRAFT_271736 [Aplosporella prunicola CBS 121167]KAF2141879.1 hypothetical protein K452DRAFT_271736 [Aplosporella prunicola CBS 121167]
MSREPSLPLAFDFDEPPSSPPPLPHTYSRKRTRSYSHHDPGTSSDPVMFSSDDAPEDVENYSTPDRRKRQYTGAWWAHGHRSKSLRTETKAELSRNVDSGVWLNSDSSDDSLIERLAAAATTHDPHFKVMSAEHMVANAKVQECIEEGDEKVDLSGLQLRNITGDIIQPLEQMIRHPHFGSEAPTEDQYEALTASLQVFLSNNLLRSLPGELWHLKNLTVLSLRNNQLTEIPPAIANLKNLKELNLAGNKLRWLPWELFQLITPRGNLSRLTVTPNPFVHAIELEEGILEIPNDAKGLQKEVTRLKEKISTSEDATIKNQAAWKLKLFETMLQHMQRREIPETPPHSYDDSGYRELRPWRAWKQYPVFFASTPVARMEFDGSLARGSPQRPSQVLSNDSHFPWPSLDYSPAEDLRDIPSTRVPSLFELSLRTASRCARPKDLRDLLPPDSPDPVLRAIDETVKASDNGGQHCSVCHKEYVLPRAEWLEYWHYVPDSLVCSANECYLPFLRKACSWGCAKAVKGGELFDEDYA